MKSQRLPALGFIGLGNMGSRMAERLYKAGYPLIGYDIDPVRGTRRAAVRCLLWLERCGPDCQRCESVGYGAR